MSRSAIYNSAYILFGVGAGLLIVMPLDAVTAESALFATSIATTCYVASAAFGVPRVAWLAVPAVTVAVTVGDLVAIAPRWAAIAVLATAVGGVGLIRARRRTLVQGSAMIGFLGVGIVSAYLDPRLGLGLGGLVLAAHAIWDWLHYRRGAVVARSFALWCIALDLTAGGICLAVAIGT